MSVLKSVTENATQRFLANHEVSDKLQVWDFKVSIQKAAFEPKVLEGKMKMNIVLWDYNFLHLSRFLSFLQCIFVVRKKNFYKKKTNIKNVSYPPFPYSFHELGIWSTAGTRCHPTGRSAMVTSLW